MDMVAEMLLSSPLFRHKLMFPQFVLLSPFPRLRGLIAALTSYQTEVEEAAGRYATGIPFSGYQYGQGASFSTRLTKSLTEDGSTTTRSFWVIKGSFNARI